MRATVLGGSGMLGSQVVKEAQRLSHEVFSPTHAECPIEDSRAIFTLLHPASRGAPEVVINCAGVTDMRRPYEAVVNANVLGPRHLGTYCEKYGVRLVHVSTDCVFSGRRSDCTPCDYCECPQPYTITSLPDPVDLYGRSKLLGETLPESALIVRCSFVGAQSGLLRWLIEHRGQEVEGYANAAWNGSSVQAVARALVEEAVGTRAGVQHAASREWLSKATLLRMLSDILDLGVTVRDVDGPYINRRLEPTICLPPLEQAFALLREEPVPA